MARPNDRCPCGLTEKKYKKCCRIKGLYTKKSHLPSSWKNLGESHPSFRFSIGDRIETDLADVEETIGHPQWLPGTIRGFNANGTYDVLLDYHVGKFGLDVESRKTNSYTRPLGFTKPATYLTDPCATCGVNEPTEGESTFLQCGDCRRTRYCTPTCQRTDWKKHRVLCQAIVAQNERVSIEIKELIKTGKSEALNNALVDAVYTNDLVIIRKLLKKRGNDIDVNTVNIFSDGGSPIFIASEKGNVNLVKVLIQAGGDVDQAKTTTGCTPVYIASQEGNVDLVKVLVEAACDVNQATTSNGESPLFIAAQYGNVDLVKVLIKAGSNVNQLRTTDGCSPLFIASEKGNVDVLKVLIEAGGTVNQALTTDERTPLWMAAQEGHIDAVKVLIEAACDVNQPSDDNQTALSTSSQNGHLEIVRLLLQQPNIDVNKGAEGRSPLALAKNANHNEIVQLLKDASAE